jgi:anti-sigma factor RsiW
MSQDQASNHDEIAALIDGEVTGAAAAVLAQRLAAEPQLAARARRIRALDDLVRQAVPVADAVPADLVARLGLADVTAATAPSA